VAQLEKGEVIKQNIEYDLAKTKKDLAAERQFAANREASMKDAIAALQSMFCLCLLHVLYCEYSTHI